MPTIAPVEISTLGVGVDEYSNDLFETIYNSLIYTTYILIEYTTYILFEIYTDVFICN